MNGKRRYREGRTAERNEDKTLEAKKKLGAAKKSSHAEKAGKAESQEEIKRKSDERRAQRAKKNIRIHGKSIENLDETAEREKREAVEVKETGYRTKMRLVYVESRLNWARRIVSKLLGWCMPPGQEMMPGKYTNCVEMKRKFVRDKVVTRCVSFSGVYNKGKDKTLCMQVVPLEFINRGCVEHVKKKRWSWLRAYPYYAELSNTSAPALMLESGVNPMHSHRVTYEVTEIMGKDRMLESPYYYRMKPVGEYVPVG